MQNRAHLAIVLLAIFLLLSASACGSHASSATTRSVKLPNLLNSSAGSAEQRLKKLGLKWRWKPARRSKDMVYAQAPVIGSRVRVGSVVLLVPASSHIGRSSS